MELRSSEIEAELNKKFKFSPYQRLVVRECARLLAYREAIDRELDHRGLVDKYGEPRSLVRLRSRILRELDHWLAKIDGVMEREASSDEPLREVSDYIRELARIGFGEDHRAHPRDRILALKEAARLTSAAPLSGPSYSQEVRQMSDEELTEELRALTGAIEDLDQLEEQKVSPEPKVSAGARPKRSKKAPATSVSRESSG
jgi:hypothetical protein